MFDNLSEKLERTIKRLRGHGKITERNIDEALREVRLALLEADVHFQVVKDFLERVRTQSVGHEVLASLTPEQHFIKIVNAELAALMGGQAAALDLSGPSPLIVALVGLNGAGKTTSVAKLAKHLMQQGRPAPYLVPADVYRPAAIEQLATLARQIGCPVHESQPGDDPVALCSEAVAAATQQGRELILIDTAGRLQVNDELMEELSRLKSTVRPHRVLLVVDAMTGQDAVNAASGFHQRIGVDGVILTKLDGDARGGAALSIRTVTGAPILFAGVGEKLDALEVFHPDRMATRILGMGDILSLIEKAERVYDQKQAVALQQKLRRNEFTLEDFRDQIRAVRQMGNIAELLKMIPGMKKLTRGMELEHAESELQQIEAIINSMTKQERRDHTILNGSRRQRIARGSGTTVAEVNRFLKQFLETKKMMKQMSKFARSGAAPGLLH
jgi:signal recognition particle subunit SRP54